MPYRFNNVLLISGTGRDSGKTSYACKIIELNTHLGAFGIKISSHFHLQDHSNLIIERKGKFEVYLENNTETGKDSSRMLKSGAEKVFYIQSKRDCTLEAFLQVYNLAGHVNPIICESGGLRNLIIPGVNILMKKKERFFFNNQFNFKPNIEVEMNNTGFSVNPNIFEFRNSSWKMIGEGWDKQLKYSNKVAIKA